MSGSLFLEDIVLGRSFETAEHLVTPAEIAAFGKLTRDEHPLHTDEAYCRSRGFRTVIAHGLFGLSLMEGLKTELGLYAESSIASLGWDKVRFRQPILAGDRLRLTFRFIACRQSSRGDRGVVTEHLELRNQHGEIVIDAEHASLLSKRS